ncbi:MAG: DUF2752 domain-containing protein [Ilumatobacteraceae bacterium]
MTRPTVGGALRLLEHGPVLCPIRRVTGLPCPTCGMTRSVLALVRGDLVASVAAHPAGPILAVGLPLIRLSPRARAWARARWEQPAVRATIAGAWIAFAAARAVRSAKRVVT